MHLNILYATQTGLSQEVAEFIATYSVACGGESCSVQSMDAVTIEEWESLSPLLIVCSTTGQGDPPQPMRSSWDSLKMGDCREFKNLRFAVFGLGDSSYPKYNYTGKMLHNRLKQLGASALLHRGLGDEQDAGGVWEGVEAFVKLLIPALMPSVSQCLDVLSAPPTTKFGVSHSSESSADVHHQVPTTTFTVASTTKLTADDHFQTISHVDFFRESQDYQAVDAVGIFPRSNGFVATSIASHFGFDSSSVIVLSSAEDKTHIKHTPPPFLGHPINIVELLVRFFDLESCASRSFFHCCKWFCHDAEERERLEEIASMSLQADYLSYCYKEKRSAFEVLSEFPHCTVPFDVFLSHLKPMRPRYYSLSSSPKADTLVCSVTVAELKIVTPYKRTRYGVCSRWLCEAKAGDTFEGFLDISPSRIPLNTNEMQPLILVGPGTGIAPMRSIIREAVAMQWKGPVFLFVGCRSPTKDYVYKSEWESAQEHIDLRVATAFSRFQGSKCYVQHRIVDREIAASLGKLIGDGGIILVCGNSKQMPRDVERAFTSAVQHFVCQGSESEAVQYINLMKRERRYITDTWS